jgi:hypothetical protein
MIGALGHDPPASILSPFLFATLRSCGTLIGNMLIEIWERLRGYHKWVQTEATIKSSELDRFWVAANPGKKSEKMPAGAAIREWRSTCTLTWTDAAKRAHAAQFEVSDNSPLFQLYEGQKVSIRYNPASPGEFYLPGVLKSKLLSGIKWTICTLVVFVVALFILYLH